MAAPEGPIARLVVCVLGIYVCYLAYGIAQEGVYKFRAEDGSKFGATTFLLFVQCVTNALCAVAVMAWERSNGTKHTNVTFTARPMLMSASYVTAMFCSNEALKFVNYPTQAVAKSCKMIPVMLMGVVLGTKKYTWREYACVGLITAGIVIFRLAKSKAASTENSTVGLILLFASLICDGLTGPIQEKIQVASKTTSPQMMFLCNFWAIVYAGAGCFATGQLQEGSAFVAANPALNACPSIVSGLEDTSSGAGGASPMRAAFAAAALSTVIGEPVSSSAGISTPLTLSITLGSAESGSARTATEQSFSCIAAVPAASP
jgi:UDP-galactose transporter B1